MYLYGLIVAMLWAYYPFLLKGLNVDPITIWAMMMIFAAVGAIFVLLGRKLVGGQSVCKMTRKDVLTLAICAFIGPVLAFLLYFYLIQNCKHVSILMALAFTSPIFAAMIGYLFFNERINWSVLLGLLFIVCGVTIVLIHRERLSHKK